MKQYQFPDKKGDSTIVVSAILLLVVLSLILYFGNYHLRDTFTAIKDTTHSFSAAADKYIAWRTGEKTKVEKENLAEDNKKFAAFYASFVHLLDTCYSATNQPCYCTLEKLPFPPSGYKISLEKRSQGGYYAFPYRQEGNQQFLVETIKGPYHFHTDKQTQLCLYDRVYRGDLPSVEIVTKSDGIYFQSNGAQNILSMKKDQFLSIFQLINPAKSIAPSGAQKTEGLSSSLPLSSVCFISADPSIRIDPLPSYIINILKNTCESRVSAVS